MPRCGFDKIGYGCGSVISKKITDKIGRENTVQGTKQKKKTQTHTDNNYVKSEIRTLQMAILDQCSFIQERTMNKWTQSGIKEVVKKIPIIEEWRRKAREREMQADLGVEDEALKSWISNAPWRGRWGRGGGVCGDYGWRRRYGAAGIEDGLENKYDLDIMGINRI